MVFSLSFSVYLRFPSAICFRIYILLSAPFFYRFFAVSHSFIFYSLTSRFLRQGLRFTQTERDKRKSSIVDSAVLDFYIYGNFVKLLKTVGI